MKAFMIPEVEFIYFEQKDIITASATCEDCGGVCDEGKNDCPCYDFPSSNQ